MHNPFNLVPQPFDLRVVPAVPTFGGAMAMHRATTETKKETMTRLEQTIAMDEMFINRGDSNGYHKKLHK